MKSKRLILALLLLLGTLLISGCGTSTSQSRRMPEDDWVPSEVSEEEEEPAEEEPAEEKPAEEPAEEEPAEEPAEEKPAEEEPVEQKINEGIFEVPAFGSSSEETEESTFIFGSSPEESESVGSISETEAAYFRAMLRSPSALDMTYLEPPVELMDRHFELLNVKGDWEEALYDMEAARQAFQAHARTRIFVEGDDEWDEYSREQSRIMDEMDRASNAAKSARNEYDRIYRQAVQEWDQYLSSYGLGIQDFLP